MRDQKRITVLLGAGAMMEVTKLSCYSITQNVIAKRQMFLGMGNGKLFLF